MLLPLSLRSWHMRSENPDGTSSPWTENSASYRQCLHVSHSLPIIRLLLNNGSHIKKKTSQSFCFIDCLRLFAAACRTGNSTLSKLIRAARCECMSDSSSLESNRRLRLAAAQSSGVKIEFFFSISHIISWLFHIQSQHRSLPPWLAKLIEIFSIKNLSTIIIYTPHCPLDCVCDISLFNNLIFGSHGEILSSPFVNCCNFHSLHLINEI